MNHANAFSSDYLQARSRLVEAATTKGWKHRAMDYGVDDLTIDALWLGPQKAKRVCVVSSALHGVEGYLGSAIQLQFASATPPTLPKGTAVLLLHALNPYGFHNTRRWDIDNIDLNRNFLLDDQAFEGSPELYPSLDGWFNPKTPVGPLRLGFYAQAVSTIARKGMPALKDTLPVGQYDFPKGLFFGGNGPSRTQMILKKQLPRWLRTADRVIHIDFHSGIGTWAGYKLFPNHTDEARLSRLNEVFGAESIEPWDPAKTSYTIRGGLGEWLAETFPFAEYDCLTAEFGTYNVLRIVEALRTENRQFQWGEPTAPATRSAKSHLKEAFAPKSADWRNRCVEQGLGIVRQALGEVLS